MTITYVSPTGTGTKSGSSAANALSVTSLDTAIQLAGAGGTVRMLADKGAYDLTSSIWISHGGSARAPVTIMGADSAGHEMNIQINGTRPPEYLEGMASGNEIFKLISGANNLVFENMAFANVGAAFRAGADIRNIVIQDMDADNVQRFFEDYVSGTNASATVSGLTIRNVEVHGFSKGVIRLQYDSHDILIENVRGDSERQDGDGIAMGIHLDGTVHDAVIRNATMMNAQSSTNDYWNGDGFATEGGVYNVTFENTIAMGNADGGYDLKSAGTILINAVAEDNGRNFRLWGETTLIDPVGVDPHKWGGLSGGQSQIQTMAGANVTVTGGSFVDSGSATAVVVNDGGTVTFSGTSFVYATGGWLKAGSGSSGTLGIDNGLVKTVAATGTYSINGETLLVPASTYDGTAGDDLFVATSNDDWTVNGLAGKDRITTLGGADTISGGKGNDVIASGDGNDTLNGGNGDDVLDGAAGSDIAVYSGKASNYKVVENSDGSWSIVDLRRASPDGSDKLWNVELLQFSDSLKTLGSQTQTPPSGPANVAPAIISATATGAATEWADNSPAETANTPHTASGAVIYGDADALDLHTSSYVAKGTGYLGALSLNTAAIDSGDTVGWSFEVSDSAMESLKAGETKTQLYDVTIDDGHGGAIAQTITITLNGADDVTIRARRARGSEPDTAQELGLPGSPLEDGRHGQSPSHPGADLATLLGAHLHPGDYAHV